MRPIAEILKERDYNRVHTLLTSKKKPFATTWKELEAQYDPRQHKVFDEHYRPKKKVNVPTGKKDPTTGIDLTKTKMVERVRIALPCQRVIVERAVGFLLGNKAEYRIIARDGQRIKNPQEGQTKLFNALLKIFHQNKIKYFDKRLARTLFAERECAELWYMPTGADGKIDINGKMRVRLLARSLGDELFPHYTDDGDMDGFARKYKVYDELGTSVNHFDVYTSLFVYQYEEKNGGWVMTGQPRPHGFTKIPVVYYRQEEAEWECVQWAIERAENLVSNWGDTNDYFGTPKYYVKGKLKGFAEKGEQGAVFTGDKDTEMNVLSWDNSPSSITGELSTLLSIIFSYSHSADISFERMKELGNNTSGAAIRLMFTDPHMNAETKTELFGEMFTRRANIVANGICHTGIGERGISEHVAGEIEFEPIFKPFIPKNETEQLNLISTSMGGKPTTSQRRAVELNPINDDPDKVMAEMEEEQAKALQQAASMMGVGGSANSVEE